MMLDKLMNASVASNIKFLSFINFITPMCTLNDLRKLLYKRLILEKIMKLCINDFHMMLKFLHQKYSNYYWD